MMFKKKDAILENCGENELIDGKEGQEIENEQKADKANVSRDELISAWQRDAEQLKILVPDFNLDEAVKNTAFANALLNGKTVIEAYKETMQHPKQEKRQEIPQNARNARRGTGGTTLNPAKFSDADFRKYIDEIKNG